mmetsp:Transcript_2664/g.5966  ORF Transcript_2664/g.5966 Transcript_2664/m.5966 type:complete len:139 (-) Transcript_2664:1125-1541(-)
MHTITTMVCRFFHWVAVTAEDHHRLLKEGLQREQPMENPYPSKNDKTQHSIVFFNIITASTASTSAFALFDEGAVLCLLWLLGSPSSDALTHEGGIGGGPRDLAASKVFAHSSSWAAHSANVEKTASLHTSHWKAKSR